MHFLVNCEANCLWEPFGKLLCFLPHMSGLKPTTFYCLRPTSTLFFCSRQNVRGIFGSPKGTRKILFEPKGTCILRKLTYPLAPSKLLRIPHERISRQRVRPFFCSRQRAWSKSSLRQRVQHMVGHLPKASYVVFCLKQKFIGLLSPS